MAVGMDDSGDFYGASWEDGGGELGFNGCGKEVVAGQIAAGQTRCLRWWRRLEFTVAGIGSVAWAEGWHDASTAEERRRCSGQEVLSDGREELEALVRRSRLRQFWA
ncbi:hypothetical protein M0R45_016437 [Rubus argutus]|uniref:MHC class I antigen n=1 Tax=Rubus argutus TaxID=59490 RepID=A0AAW1XV13_RUBAR